MITISLKEMRKQKGLSQAALADAVGVHQSCIQAWENGKWFPRASKLKELSKIFDCSIDELLKEDEQNDN